MQIALNLTTDRRVLIVATLVIGISMLHYVTGMRQTYVHSVYGEFYILPLLIAGLWFGLKGALVSSLGASALYVPFLIMRYPLTPLGFDRILGITVLVLVTIVVGVLSDREAARVRALKESERLAAIGQTVSAVAHEIKTPLIAIAGYARQVIKHLADDEVNREKLEIVLTEARRLEILVREMLDFSRPLQLKKVPGDPLGLLAKCLAVANKAAAGKVKIETRVAPTLPPVHLDEEKMQQVLINLIINAVDASLEGQKVDVSAYGQGGTVCFDVTDHGTGVPPEIRDKLFVPFFTTKKHGTGLGLPIAQKIAQAHGGDISVHSNPEGGSTFRVRLTRFH